MALKKQKRKKITPRTALIIGLVLFAFTICGLLVINTIGSYNSPVEENKPIADNTETKREETKPSGEADKNDDPSFEDASAPPEGEKTPFNYDGKNPNKNSDLTGIITTSRVSGDKLIIRVSIDQYLSSGSCQLLLAKSSKTYEESTEITSDASTSTCEGFDIPVSNLESGLWSIKINLNSGDKTGNIEGEANIE